MVESFSATQGKPLCRSSAADHQLHLTVPVACRLDYPGIGPEHSYLSDIGRAEYYAVTDAEALEAFQQVSRLEGIIPALETSHAFAYLKVTPVLCSLLDPFLFLLSLEAPCAIRIAYVSSCAKLAVFKPSMFDMHLYAVSVCLLVAKATACLSVYHLLHAELPLSAREPS